MEQNEEYINNTTKALLEKILENPNAAQYGRIVVGAGLGSFRLLKDRAGLAQTIEYCQRYLSEIEDESINPN